MLALGMGMTTIPSYAALDEGGVITIANETSTSGDYEDFYTNSTIGGYDDSANVAVMDSNLPGVDALKLTSAGGEVNAQWLPKQDEIDPNVSYELFVYNINGIEKWRNTSSADSVQERRARYTITSANGKTVKFLDQETASGGESGWVSLGVYRFKGDGTDRIRLDKDYIEDWRSVTYADDVKLVPITGASTKLSHVYANINETVTEEAVLYDTLNQTATDVNSNRFAVVIPYGEEMCKVNLETLDAAATVSIDGGEATVGGAVIDVDTTTVGITRYTVKVEAEGVESSTYLLSVEVESDDSREITASTAATEESRYGKFARFEPNLTTDEAGWYNIYAKWSKIANNKISTPFVNVVVNHNGLKDEKTVAWDMNANDGWVYIGKYYFSGKTATEWNEQIKLMNSTGSKNYFTADTIKMVKSEENLYDDDLSGVALQMGGYVHSIPASAIKNGGLCASGTVGSAIGITIEGTGSVGKGLSVKINGEEVVTGVHQTAWYSNSVPGENMVEISYAVNDETRTYTFSYYNETGTEAKKVEGWQASDSTLRNQHFYAPISADSYRNNGENTKNAAAFLMDAGVANPVYKPAFAQSTDAHVLVWKPVFFEGAGNSFGSENQKIIVTSNGEATELVIDWTSGVSEWIDLGIYTFSDANDGIEIVNDQGIGLLYDDVKFLPVINAEVEDEVAVAIDNVDYSIEALNGLTIEKEDSVININPKVKSTSEVLINGEKALIGKNNMIDLSEGINTVTLTIDGIDYIMNVISTGVCVNYADDSVTGADGLIESAFVGADGISKAAYINSVDKSVRFSADGIEGKTEVWVYQIGAAKDSAAADEAVINIAANKLETAKLDNTKEASGWIKVGTYIFGGKNDGSEYVEICGQDGKNVYVDSVKFVVPEDKLFIDEATLVNENGGLKGTVKVYKQNTVPAEITPIVAEFDSTGRFVKLISKNTALTEAGLKELETETVTQNADSIYKLFVWDGLEECEPFADAVSTK